MKTKNLYYTVFFKRKSIIKEMSLFIFVFVITWPRILLEVFIRKNFGVRYFSMVKAVLISIFLFFIPISIDKIASFGGKSVVTIIFTNISWYISLAAFLYFCYKRHQEVKREPGVFDFAKFSYYNGDIDDRFYNIKIKGKEINRRLICTLIEPAFFCLIGIVLSILMQKVGILILFCSMCYSLGYIGEYVRGDHFIMDTIDKMISNEEMVNSFVDGREPEDTRGFETYGRKPVDPEFRRNVANNFYEDETYIAS
ncbi:hypothetical protein KXD93_25505 [Mucilaginibacter sp. BJC16-A38]|uniref:hypothetical protein n=1 Tax=Mucilaginibacter phenanthrenivorans TaxID=1234842 RepID=UPI0021584616|nr:hypothetical protein [Mucilaginibacter phenanthrenivorans]MCR8561039.1 hypothetical protein [Mucilaginibacter phenanthrenivorans]